MELSVCLQAVIDALLNCNSLEEPGRGCLGYFCDTTQKDAFRDKLFAILTTVSK